MQKLYTLPATKSISKRVIFIAAALLILIMLSFIMMMQRTQYKTAEHINHPAMQSLKIEDNTLVHQTAAKKIEQKPIVQAKIIETKALEPDKAYAASINIYSNTHTEDEIVAKTEESAPPLEPTLPQLPFDANNYKEQNMQSHKENFLQLNSHSSQYLRNFNAQKSRLSVQAGSIIPAVLNTTINSDLPGFINAHVARNVYDTVSGNYLLIPQGSKLLGRFDSQVAYGQSRILVAWNKLIFPDGNSINLENMPGVDNLGAAGLHDTVDKHYFKIFGSSLLYSVIGAIGQLSQAPNANNITSAPQTAVAAAGQQLSQTGSQFVAKEMNVQPTLIIRAGTLFNVFLSKDLILPYAFTH